MTNTGEFYVTKGSAFVYNMLGEICDEVFYGWKVTAVGSGDGTKIFCKTDYGYAGYIGINCLSSDEYMPTHRVKSRFCDVLPLPRYQSIPIDTLPLGARIRIIDEGEKFCLVDYAGKEAYVPAVHIEKIPSSGRATPAKIISSAKQYLGTPYRWGGKSPLGIDCSGLCFMAYYLNGINIYRDARFPFYSDYEVKVERLRPCDLVFFRGHVAMYIGNGKVIHSNSHDGGVCISPLDKDGLLACASLYPLIKKERQ